MIDFINFSEKILSQSKDLGLNEKMENDYDLLCDLQSCILEINKSPDKVISNKYLVDLINHKFSFENEQQDSFELYHRIIEIYENLIESICKIGFKNELTNPFEIKFQTLLKCELCNNILKRIDTNFEVSVTPKAGFVLLTFILEST